MKTRSLRALPALLALLFALFWLAPDVQAQRGYWNPGGGDNAASDRRGSPRRAQGCGDTISLERVLRRVRRQFPGRLLDADMRCSRRGAVYILKMRGRDNRIRVIRADAATGRILSASRR